MLDTIGQLIERLSKRDPNETIYSVIWSKDDIMPELPDDQTWTEAQIKKVFEDFDIGERSWDSIGDDESYARESLAEFRCADCYEYDLRTIQLGKERKCPSCGEESEVV